MAKLGPLLLIILALTATLFVPMQGASFAQVAEPPLARLAELTYRKGYANAAFGPALADKLGILSGTIVYQAPYHDRDGLWDHASSVYKDHNKASETWRVVLVLVPVNSPAGVAYLTGPNANLDLALKGSAVRDGYVWTPIPKDQALDGFQKELNYWKTQQDVLEHEPDRVDPKGSKQ